MKQIYNAVLTGVLLASCGATDRDMYDNAVSTRQEEGCLGINDLKLKVDCYTNIAVVKEDPNICYKGIKPSCNQYTCETKVALAISTLEKCERLRDSNLVELCKDHVTGKANAFVFGCTEI